MSTDRLYIIGNGFDIHHGISSRYSDFKKFLSVSDHALHDLVEKFIPIRENWSDLEQALANIEVDRVVEYASQFLVSYGAEDWSDSYHHDYRYEVNNIIEGLSKELKRRFTDWIEQVHIPKRIKVKGKLLDLDRAATYLTFNYTSTLFTIYEIPRADVVFIHGEAGSPNQDIVLGHAWNPKDIPSLNNVTAPESLDTRIIEGNEIVDEYFGTTFKNTASVINANKSFFNRLS